jgi:pimeloyl-ACP methyl ester carboxylesterase
MHRSKLHLYSITSSARASSDGATLRPSALAVLRFMINSTLVTCWTGRSTGFSPLRMRASRGYRAIAHDRRGHGRSSQAWNGNDMDTYADDLADLVQKLDLKNAIHIGHSTGGGEVARYIGRHGTKRVAKAVLISAGRKGRQ